MRIALWEAVVQFLNQQKVAEDTPVNCLKLDGEATACNHQEIFVSLVIVEIGIAGYERLSENGSCTRKIRWRLSPNTMPDSSQAVCVSSSDQAMHQMSHKMKVFEAGVVDQAAEEGNGDYPRGWTKGGSVVFDRFPKEETGDSSGKREKTDFMFRRMAFDVESSHGNRSSCGLDERVMSQEEANMEMQDPAANGSLGVTEPSVGDPKLPDLDVIVIEDDDDVDSENCESYGDGDGCDSDSGIDASSMEVPRFFIRRNGKESADHLSTATCELSDSSDEEDCCVLDLDPSRRLWQSSRVKKPSGRHRDKLFDLSDDRNSSDDSSDCEIVEGPCRVFCQRWEQAAIQKKFGKATMIGHYRAESEGSTSASNPATGISVKQRRHRKPSDLSPESECEVKEQEELNNKTSLDIPVGPANSKSLNYRKEAVVSSDQQCDNYACSNLRPTCEANGDEALLSEKMSNGLISNAVSLLDKPEEGSTGARAVEAIPGIDLIGDREKLKQTAEFRHADEEEWARRQMELEKQAQEVHRLRKRKKAEENRKMLMENRQKQRLEEIRRSQQKEEQNLDFKEQVRGRVREELERLAATCIDMATLLRRLGVEVDGGAFPSVQQVNAAYKRALLRFHPDRIMAMAKSDPLCQVEAEETFKLVSRLKNTMQPVTNCYFP
eukprot:c28806_g1_i1 orf=422-2413(-)